MGSLILIIILPHQTRSSACQGGVCTYQHLLQWNVFNVFLSSGKSALKDAFPDFDGSLGGGGGQAESHSAACETGAAPEHAGGSADPSLSDKEGKLNSCKKGLIKSFTA